MELLLFIAGGEALPRTARILSMAILIMLLTIPVEGIRLSSEERGELARKFKYYHRSVRPSDPSNLVDTRNGTFFRLDTEVEILQTIAFEDKLQLEMLLVVHFRDDRLLLRELRSMVTIPNEFHAWTPAVQVAPQLLGTYSSASAAAASPGPLLSPIRKTTHLDPRSGEITVIHRVSGWVPCFAEEWRRPFERYHCQLVFGTEHDEHLFLRPSAVRDLRRHGEKEGQEITHSFGEWPDLSFHFSYRSRGWPSAIANFYLPSLLMVLVSMLAQRKRRKLQVIVTLASLLSLIIIQSAHRSPTATFITLQDLWVCGLMLHLVAVMAADLLLPSRRLTITTYSSPSSGGGGGGGREEDVESLSGCSPEGCAIKTRPTNSPGLHEQVLMNLKWNSSLRVVNHHQRSDQGEDAGGLSAVIMEEEGLEGQPNHTPKGKRRVRVRMIRRAHTPTTSNFNSLNNLSNSPAHATTATTKGMGGRKRIALLAILTSFTAFLTGYTILVLITLST